MGFNRDLLLMFLDDIFDRLTQLLPKRRQVFLLVLQLRQLYLFLVLLLQFLVQRFTPCLLRLKLFPQRLSFLHGLLLRLFLGLFLLFQLGPSRFLIFCYLLHHLHLPSFPSVFIFLRQLSNLYLSRSCALCNLFLLQSGLSARLFYSPPLFFGFDQERQVLQNNIFRSSLCDHRRALVNLIVQHVQGLVVQLALFSFVEEFSNTIVAFLFRQQINSFFFQVFLVYTPTFCGYMPLQVACFDEAHNRSDHFVDRIIRCLRDITEGLCPTSWFGCLPHYSCLEWHTGIG
mmetsp:Transcript_13228/g.25716  ORF Transcript_13228/g.25716 Transcript_13228/m.25716 type:complete len:287 (+) Transcript_13228:839-1699(+)